MSDTESFWQQYGNLFSALGIALLIFLVFFFVSIFISRVLWPRLDKRLSRKKQPILTVIVRSFNKPTALFLKVAGVCCALLYLCVNLPDTAPQWLTMFTTWLEPILGHIVRIATIIWAAWGLMGARGITSLIMKRAGDHLDVQASKSVRHFLSAIYSVLVIAFAAIMIITELGYNVNALITSLGLSGLTIALAAKDSAANFLGGLILITERPFEIGDSISCGEIEGVVEDISIRSTKIRTGPGSLTTVPNSNLSDAAITNWSGNSMAQRRADFTLGLLYDTTEEEMRTFLGSVRTMLESDPDIQADTVLVRFSALSASSLDIQVRFYTTQPGYGDHMRILERVNFSLIELAKTNGVEYAYPTQTLYIQNEQNDTGAPPDTQ